MRRGRPGSRSSPDTKTSDGSSAAPAAERADCRRSSRARASACPRRTASAFRAALRRRRPEPLVDGCPRALLLLSSVDRRTSTIEAAEHLFDARAVERDEDDVVTRRLRRAPRAEGEDRCEGGDNRSVNAQSACQRASTAPLRQRASKAIDTTAVSSHGAARPDDAGVASMIGWIHAVGRCSRAHARERSPRCR